MEYNDSYNDGLDNLDDLGDLDDSNRRLKIFIVILMIFCVFLFIGMILYFFVIKDSDNSNNSNNSTNSNTNNSNNSNNSTNSNAKTNNANLQEFKEEIKSLESNDINMLKQYSQNPCIKDVNYGKLSEESGIYTKDNCRGLFTYKGKMGYCGSSEKEIKDGKEQGKMQECPLNTFKDTKNKDIIGLVDSKLELVDSNGKCENNYRLLGYDKMIVRNGCSGTFKLGPLIGLCESNENDTQTCPIGHTINKNNKNFGLWYSTYSFFPDNDILNCNHEGLPTDTYGIYDSENIYLKDNCAGRFKWNKISKQCNDTNDTNDTNDMNNTKKIDANTRLCKFI